MNTMDQAAELGRRIDLHPRFRLGHLPTPLEPLKRLSSWLGGPSVWVKRDDASGLGQGGNKVRALEFVIPEVLASGADILLTSGVIQSNAARQIAAAAAKVGLDCHIAMITDRVARTDPDYLASGNILLDRLFGASWEPISIKDDRAAVMERIAVRLRGEGRRPYLVPYGCANRLGAVGYLAAAREIAEQADRLGLALTHVVHASGTGGTQAGLIAGFAALGRPVEVIGIDVDADPPGVRFRVQRLLRELADELGLEPSPLERTIRVEGDYSAGAYGVADEGTLEAVAAAARLEALIVDPVYAGKCLAGIIGMSRAGRLKPTDTVVFLHTGGTPALYAYRSLFEGIMERSR